MQQRALGHEMDRAYRASGDREWIDHVIRMVRHKQNRTTSGEMMEIDGIDTAVE